MRCRPALDSFAERWRTEPVDAQRVHDIASAFTWSPDGKFIAHVMDNSVCVTDVATGNTRRVTPRRVTTPAHRGPEACVFSSNGNEIAFVRREKSDDVEANQICVAFLNRPKSGK